LSNIPPSLVQEISPDHGVTPYESGDLAIDYQPAFYNATRGAVANLSLPELAANPNWSRGLMIEDPETDIVGEEFLLSEIAFYTEVLHQDWTTFWRSVDPGLLVNASWSDAWTAFNVSSGGPPMLSSYATDPAAVAASGTPSFGATLLHWNGTTYAWRAIYGLGIVKGSSHLALDQAFVDWFLGRDVQTALPTSEWEYPANETIPLPTVFQRWAVDPPGVVQLNSAFPPSTIPGALPGWLDEWQALDNQYG
ncbi:MAG TPA: extracellular solute-binding protein, partial [Thermoplasmata archaeon]|nr:extracellular solute-binding protein [Thermoplasmata archaeon]